MKEDFKSKKGENPMSETKKCGIRFHFADKLKIFSKVQK